jgi:hypothetical protein
MLPFCHTISNKISRLLEKCNIRTIHIPKKRETTQMAEVCQVGLELKVLGVYRDHVSAESVCRIEGKDYQGEVQITLQINISASTQEISSGRI